jgi:hypothetical protein
MFSFLSEITQNQCHDGWRINKIQTKKEGEKGGKAIFSIFGNLGILTANGFFCKKHGPVKQIYSNCQIPNMVLKKKRV